MEQALNLSPPTCSACVQSPLSASAKTLLSGAFWTTDCVSEQQGEGRETPALPHELLDAVIVFAKQEMKEKSDGAALAKLMHLSSSIRRKIVQEFQPVPLHECPVEQDDESAHQVRLPRALITYIWQSIDFYLLDFSTKRVTRKPEVTDYCTISTTDGNWTTDVAFRLMLEARPHSSNFAETGIHVEEDTRISETPRISEEYDLDLQDIYTVSDICRVLQPAFAKLGPPPRIVNPPHRALTGSFKAPPSCVNIKINMHLRFSTFQGHHRTHDFRHTWAFDAVNTWQVIELR